MPVRNLSVSADFCSLAGTEPAMKFPALLSAKMKPVLGHRLKSSDTQRAFIKPSVVWAWVTEKEMANFVGGAA